MHHRVLLIAVALAWGTSFGVQAATYRVGTGASCTHATAQAAIDTAEDNPGTDFIRLTRSITYNDQELRVEDQDLVIEGGWVNCQSNTPDNVRTVLNGSGDNSVIEIRGSGDVVLRKFTLTGGHEPLTPDGYGGGLQISGGPHLVSVSELVVSGNEAGHGGGISVKNDESDDITEVTLVLGDDTVVSNNVAEFTPLSATSLIQGGGIYCRRSTVLMIGDGAAVLNNHANQDGGGIGADRCRVDIAPHGAAFNGISLNEAGRDGGGIAMQSLSYLNIYATDPDRPVEISGNTAGHEGGGIKSNTRTTVKAWDTIIAANRSLDEGGAISIYNDDDNDDGYFSMYGSLEGAPANAVLCNPEHRCNRIDGNIAMSESGDPKRGAAIRVLTNSNVLAARATTLFQGTKIERNVGETTVWVDEINTGESHIAFAGAAITGNEASDMLISVTGEFDMWASTVAGNTIGSTVAIFVLDGGTSIPGMLSRSIIWQPGKVPLDRFGVGGFEQGSVLYLLANQLGGDIPASTTNFVAEPRFVDPETGDFHLQPSSPAVDRTQVADLENLDPEADGRARAVDLALVPNHGSGTAQDLGAYEIQTVGNLVRNGRYDDDLHLWTENTAGATAWNSDDSGGVAGSGSLQIEDSTTDEVVLGRTQCVHVPGPGAYVLGGSGWVANINLGFLDSARLAWNLRRDDSETCGAGASVTSGFAAITGTGWKTFTDQVIEVTAADWSPATTIRVQLYVDKNLGVPPSFLGRARFDNLTLIPAGADRVFIDGFEQTP